jgi:hypothetical protein
MDVDIHPMDVDIHPMDAATSPRHPDLRRADCSSRPPMRKSLSLIPLALLALACDPKKESPAPAPVVTASAPTPAAASASPSAAAPTASAAPPGKKITLRQLVWTEKTPADTKYVDCVVKTCAPALKECYGERIEQGELGGPCADLATCESRCLDRPEGAGRAACSAECVDKHRKEGGACDTCGDKVGACGDKAKCEPPIVLPH